MKADNVLRTLPAWRITLLGGLTVTANGHIVDRFEHRKSASLLAYLAFHPHRKHSREELTEMLWPEEDPELTRVRFRQALLNLRRALDSAGAPSTEILHADRTFVWLDDSAASTDVGEYETALSRAQEMDRAGARADSLLYSVGLVKGDLLPGYYDSWIGIERLRLVETQMTALSRTAAALADVGNIGGAIEVARKALATDPLREEAHIDLIRLLAAEGRTTESLRQYQDLELKLRNEFQMSPSAAAQSLMEEIKSGGPIVGSRQGAPRTSSAVTAAREVPDMPAVNSSSQHQYNGDPLPASLSPTFGREEDLSWLMDRMRPVSESTDTCRLVTLTGLGGSGKTHLALDAARQLRPLYNGALWFVALTEITDPQLLVTTIAESICGDGADIVALTDILVRRPTLLVLDNFEQIADEGANIIAGILEAVPGLKCLITSRVRLNIGAELELPVNPLQTPMPSDSAASVNSCPSVQLFVDRAQRAYPEFRLTDSNRLATASLCEKLEGIPLAIELAAAWCPLLTPSQLLGRHTQYFDLLVTNRPDIPPRHQSLRTAVESSYRALDLNLQSVFAMLSVFQGGWAIEAAERVCNDSHALSHLAMLRRCSLVITSEVNGEIRFRMLETLRAFAQAQLAEEAVEAARTRHAEYFTDLAERAAAHLTGPDQINWIRRIQSEYDNMRAALIWTAHAHGNRERAARLGAALSRFWDVRRQSKEAEEWIRRAPDAVEGIDAPLQARVLESTGHLAANLYKLEAAKSMMQRSLTLYRELGDAVGAARCLCTLGAVARDYGELDSARIMIEEALPLLEKANDLYHVGRAYGCLATICSKGEKYSEAEVYLERAATIYRSCGHRKGTAWCLCLMGMVTEKRSLVIARARYEDGLLLARMLDDRDLIVYALTCVAAITERTGDHAVTLQNLGEAVQISQDFTNLEFRAQLALWYGDMAAANKDYDEAKTQYRETLRLCAHCENTICTGSVLHSLARYEVDCSEPLLAVRLLGAAEKMGEVSFEFRGEYAMPYRLQLDDLRSSIEATAFEAEWTAGAAMSIEQASTFAVMLLEKSEK